MLTKILSNSFGTYNTKENFYEISHFFCSEDAGADHHHKVCYSCAYPPLPVRSLAGRFTQALWQPSEPEEEYDITNRNWVIDYSPGMTIQPDIRKEFEDHLATISTFADDFFPEFAAYNREMRIKWFKKALPVHILEETMDMIVDNIMDDKFIHKYVCLCCVELSSEYVKMIVRTFLWNEVLLNDFWEIVTT